MHYAKYILTIAIGLLLAACSNEGNTQLPSEGNKTLSFRILNFQQVSLDEVTRATTAETLKNLDLAIYDAATNAVVQTFHTTQGEEGYGTFSPTLPFGTYTLLFLGYDGSRTAVLSDLTAIQFAEHYVPNFFYKTLPLTVDATTIASQTVSLRRAVAAFSIRHEGPTPANLQTLKIASTGGGQVFNAHTESSQAEDMTRSYDVSAKAGGTSFTVNYYTFLPADEATMDFTVTALDNGGKEIAQHTFADVNMKINHRSIYSGNFFATAQGAASFALTLENAEWEDVNHTY